MKLNKTISAVALGLGLAVAAQAQTNTQGTAIYITGSTAFRQQIYNACTDLSLAPSQGQNGGANAFTMSGTIADAVGGALNLGTVAPGAVGQTVTMYGDFSGSAEGVETLVNSSAATYLQVNLGASTFVGGTFSHNGVDIAMSDVAASSTPAAAAAAAAPGFAEIQLASDAAYPEHTGVAVQPFMFVVNSNAFAISNINWQQVVDMYENGSETLNFFTGNSSDSSSMILPVGRYYLSGTRIGTELDVTGAAANLLGITTTTFKQFGLSADGGTTVPGLDSSDTASPPTSGSITWVNLKTKGVQHLNGGGYFTGGNVGKAIDSSTVNGAVDSLDGAIAYISPSDAAKLVHSNEGPISFNGQQPWVGGTFPCFGNFNTNGVINGSYTFWTYERMYTLDSSSSFQVQSFGPALITALEYEITHLSGWSKFTDPACGSGNFSPTACTESQMKVYRNGDGGDVTLQ